MAIHVLLVDKDLSFRQKVSERLRGRGVKVREAAGKEETLRLLERYDVDVALLALGRFRQEGLHILQAMKAVRPATPVILLTSGECLALSIEGMKLGAFDDLLIPFDVETLHERIERAWQHKRAHKRPLKSLLRRFEDLLVAASFAEAGEPEIAKEIMRQSGSPKGRKKNKHKKD